MSESIPKKPETGPQHLARLGDISISPEGLRRFNQIAETADLKVFSLEGMEQDGVLDTEKAEAEMYGLAGALINIEWEYIKKLDDEYVKGPDIPLDKDFWKIFQKQCAAILQEGQKHVQKKIENLLSQDKIIDEDVLDKEDRLVLRYLFIRHKLNKSAGFPAFSDLVSFYARFAKVAYDAFKLSKGRFMITDEFKHVLQHPTFSARMQAFMHNIRRYSIPVFEAFHEGVDANEGLDLGGEEVSMNPDYFEIIEKDGGPVLHLKDQFALRARQVMAEGKKEDEACGIPISSALRCPVIYTQKFPEMVDWMYNQLAHHLHLERGGEVLEIGS